MITSSSNDKIKEIRKLRNSKYMMDNKKFIVEGEHLVKEALKANILLETISTKEVNYGVFNTLVKENVIKSISNLKSLPDVIGICKMKDSNKILGNKIIILDNVQDPGNLGTIIRSANAFGFNDIILSNTCVKKYNEKVIRATQGMIFNMNVITKDLKAFVPCLKENGYMVYGTNVVNGINVKDIVNTEKIAVIMGSEGTGMSLDIEKLVDKNIYINMNDTCESLNVAVAAAIIMYELNK